MGVIPPPSRARGLATARYLASIFRRDIEPGLVGVRREQPPSMPLQTDQLQLASIDLGCHLAAYWVGRIGPSQHCCWRLTWDPFGGGCYG